MTFLCCGSEKAQVWSFLKFYFVTRLRVNLGSSPKPEGKCKSTDKLYKLCRTEALLLHTPQGHNFSKPFSSPTAAAAHLEKESVIFTLISWVLLGPLLAMLFCVIIETNRVFWLFPVLNKQL